RQATCVAFRCARSRLVGRSLDTRTGTIHARSFRLSARSRDRTQVFYTDEADQLRLRAFGVAVEGELVDEALPSAAEVRQDVFHVLELVEVRPRLELAPSGVRSNFATRERHLVEVDPLRLATLLHHRLKQAKQSP